MASHAVLESLPSQARELLRLECASPPNRFGAEFFDEHLVVVVDFALVLARRLGADPLVVEVAAWLHDRAAVLDFGTLPTHARDGAALARHWLARADIPSDICEGIARCIETHGAPTTQEPTTPEQRCLSNADVLSHITRPAYWYWYLYQVRNMDLAGARAWYRSRLAQWERLEPAARELVEAEYSTLRRLLDATDASLADPHFHRRVHEAIAT
ncbi:MAG: HD domain-containing protein [Polyangiaceae bacterium]